jgi:hypothetical protein
MVLMVKFVLNQIYQSLKDYFLFSDLLLDIGKRTHPCPSQEGNA